MPFSFHTISFKIMRACRPPYSNFWDMTFLRLPRAHAGLENLSFGLHSYGAQQHNTCTVWWVSPARRQPWVFRQKVVVMVEIHAAWTYVPVIITDLKTAGLSRHASFMGQRQQHTEQKLPRHVVLQKRRHWSRSHMQMLGSGSYLAPSEHLGEPAAFTTSFLLSD